jgi:DNA-binding NtrC family response regulator
VRELENLVDRLVVLKGQGVIEPEDLPEKMRAALPVSAVASTATMEIPEEGFCLDVAVREFERELITKALQKADGVKNRAAQILGIKRTTLIEKLKRHALLPSG